MKKGKTLRKKLAKHAGGSHYDPNGNYNPCGDVAAAFVQCMASGQNDENKCDPKNTLPAPSPMLKNLDPDCMNGPAVLRMSQKDMLWDPAPHMIDRAIDLVSQFQTQHPY